MPSSLLQVIDSLLQTCYNNWEQAVRTHLVDKLREIFTRVRHLKLTQNNSKIAWDNNKMPFNGPLG
jgi:hypothetical protein